MRHLVLLALLAASPVVAASAQAKGLKVGDQAPTVVVESLDGAPVDLAQYIGKRPVLLEFWATWCPLCREMEPAVKAFHKQYGDSLAIIRVVVPQNQTPERAKAYVAQYELPGVFVFDRDGKAYKAFAAFHTSYIVVLDRTGKVLHSNDGGKQDLAAVIERAVR
jgi:thiol-disulfide isomerase/thioredoxin